jgi:hypothetical protein
VTWPAAEEISLKIGRYILAIILLSASASQPGFAKESHAHHAARPSVTTRTAKPVIRMPHKMGAGPKGESVRAGPVAKGAHPIDARPRDTIDAGITAPSPRRGYESDKARNAATAIKIGVPGNSQTRHMPVAGTPNPVVRNAIGLPIAPHENMNPAAAERLRMPNPGGANSGRPNPGAITTASVSSSGKIDGTGLIRPARAATSLGGPAKAVAGISGTTFRPRY